MANNFKLKTFDGSSTGANTDMTIYTCPSSTETTIIGMSIANITSSQITVDVKLVSDTSDTETNSNVFLVKDAPVPAGGALVPVGGDQKIVLQATDVIKVQSDTANSADTTLSILEIT
tara:strand:- start:846 stop:1199 length:354 start_codon:yes stop_codon:yes gene_type:complete